MSLKLKINIVLLLCMALSTGYFLHRIDLQENIIVDYSASLNNKEWDSDIKKLLDIEERKVSYNDVLRANQEIKVLYRYIFATNFILLLSIFIVAKSINKKATVE